MPATASAMSSRDSGSGDTSRTFTAGILPTSACVLVRATARGRGGRGYHGRTVPDAGDRPMTTPTYLDHASATPLSEPAREALVSALDAFGDPMRLPGNGLAARPPPAHSSTPLGHRSPRP